MPLLAVVMSLSGLTLYAIHDALIKYLSQTISVVQIVFFITLFTFPLISIWLVGSRTTPSLRPQNPWAVGFRSLSFVVIVLAAFYSFQVLPLAQVYALLFTTPLMVTALSGPMLGERATLSQWIAIISGFVGVLVVIQPTVEAVQIGHISALTAATLSAINATLVRKLGASERSVTLLLYPLIATFVVMSLMLPFSYRPMDIQTLGISAIVALLSLSGGLLTIHAFRRGRAMIIAPMQYSQIIWGVVFGALFFGEVPKTNTLVGTLIIIGSGIFVVTRDRGAQIAQDELARRTTAIARLNSLFHLRRSSKDSERVD